MDSRGLAETGSGNTNSRQPDLLHISSWSMSLHHSNSRTECIDRNLWVPLPRCTWCSRHRLSKCPARCWMPIRPTQKSIRLCWSRLLSPGYRRKLSRCRETPCLPRQQPGHRGSFGHRRSRRPRLKQLGTSEGSTSSEHPTHGQARPPTDSFFSESVALFSLRSALVCGRSCSVALAKLPVASLTQRT